MTSPHSFPAKPGLAKSNWNIEPRFDADIMINWDSDLPRGVNGEGIATRCTTDPVGLVFLSET
jgi:hypothetical protein